MQVCDRRSEIPDIACLMLVDIALIRTISIVFHGIIFLCNKQTQSEPRQQSHFIRCLRITGNIQSSVTVDTVFGIHFRKRLCDAPSEGLLRTYHNAVSFFRYTRFVHLHDIVILMRRIPFTSHRIIIDRSTEEIVFHRLCDHIRSVHDDTVKTCFSTVENILCATGFDTVFKYAFTIFRRCG